MPELITSTHNPLIKQIRSLQQKKGREAAGLFLVEGIHPVGEAVEAGWEVETLVYAPDQLKSDFAARLVEERVQFGLHCVALSADLFASLAEKDNPQGILAIVKERHLSLEAVSTAKMNFAVALVSPQDPGNVGTILRTMDAVNAGGLFLLDGGVELYHPSVVRASMGAIFWKPVFETSFHEFVAWARKNKFVLAGTSAHAQVDYHELRRGEKPVILVFGSEQKGLSLEQLAACDLAVSMPMKGRASSLNLAVAASVLLYKMLD
jgi:RNA methyltransferase, TrmH family